MKKLTILLSVLMVAFTSVFAQEAASVTLTPHGEDMHFDEQFYYAGATSVSFNKKEYATITLTGVDKEDLVVEVLDGEVFSASFYNDRTQVKVSYNITEAKDALYKDTVIVYQEGHPDVADSLFVSVKVTEKAKLPIVVSDIAFGDVKLDTIGDGVLKSGKITIAENSDISLKKAGTNPDNFDVTIAVENGDTLLKVTFYAEEEGDYSATVTLKADNAEDKVVNLTAKAIMPDPSLSVLPAKWEETVMIKGGSANAKKNFSVIGSYLKGLVKKSFFDGTHFKWIEAEQVVELYDVTVPDTYTDTLIVSTPKAPTVKIPLVITVSRPVITAEDVDFAHVSLVNAVSGVEKEAIVTVSPADDWDFELGGANKDAFENTEKKDGKLIVKFKANAIGTYNATATIKAADAVDKVINLKAVVDMPASQLIVLPTEWKTTVKLENGQAKAERSISISALFTFSVPEGKLWKGEEAGFTWEPANSKVTFAATAEKTYQDTLIVSALGSDGKEIVKKVALEVKVEKGETPTQEVPVTSVTLNKTASDLAIGGTLQLTATVAPENATNKNVSWKSSDATIATVSAAGLVTGVKAGSATITVTTEDGGKTATCAITVKEGEVPPTPTPGDCEDYYYEFTAKPTISGGKAKLGAYEWTINPTSVIGSIDSQLGRGVQLGSKNNPAKSVSFKTSDEANCSLKDVVVNASIAKDGDATLAVYIGGTQIGEAITLTTAPTDYTFDNTAGATGDLEIRLTNTKAAMYILSIATHVGSFTPTAVTGVTLDKNEATVEAGKSVTLKATVEPANASNKKVTWSSSNEAVATVAEGVVTGKAEGTATITVKTEQGGFEAKCVVTVTKSTTPIVAVTGVKLDKTSYEIMEGLPVTLVATVEPADATNKDVTWSSSDETVATVENGLVTTLKPGTATITVKTVDGGFTATCVITVNRESPPLPSSMSFTKVTADQADWSGQYLLVYEKSASEALVFNGKDASEGAGCVAATIAGGKITLDDYAKLCIYVEKMTGGYSLKIGDNYMGGKEGANGITFSNQPIVNNFSYAGDSLTIASNNVYMRFNTTANQMRFRYYKNAGYDKAISLYKADQKIDPQPAWVPDTISVTEAIAVCSQEKTHYVKGIVGEISTSADDIAKYHNIDFMLADIDNPSTQMKCYRLWWQKMNGEFKGGEIATGDTILVYGQTTIYTDKDKNKINEIANGYVVEILGKGDGTGPVGPTPQGDPLDIDYAEAAYVVDEEGPFWFLYAGKYPADEAQENLDYPQIFLLIDNPDGKHIAGQFDIFEGSMLYLNDNDSIEFVSGTVTVTCLEEGNELYAPYYKFVAVVYDAQGKEYAYEFETEVIAYDYETDEDIVLEDKATQGIENTVVFEFDPNAPIYNIQGMQVDRNTRGILIQNGHKFIIAQ